MRKLEVPLAKAAAKGLKDVRVGLDLPRQNLLDLNLGRNLGWGRSAHFKVTISLKEKATLYVEVSGSVQAFSELKLAKPGAQRKLRKFLRALNHVTQVVENGIDA